MKVSFSTGSLYHLPLAISFAIARELGFDGVELVAGPEFMRYGPGYVKQLAEDYGVPLLSFHPPLFNLPAWRYPAGDHVAKIVRSAYALGCPVATVHTLKWAPLTAPRARRYLLALDAAPAATHGAVTVLVETSQYNTRPQPPRRPGRHEMDDVSRLVAFAERHHLGITLDTAHAGASGEDLLATYEVVRPRLRNIHFSDVLPGRRKMRTHLRPGQGMLPTPAFLRALARDGYTGLLTLEVAPQHLHAWSPRAARRYLAAALELTRRYTC
jgi:sugar phosphate isomerase/epimerase